MKNRVFQLLLVALLFPILISCNEDEDIRQGKSSELAIVIDGGSPQPGR
ncbi:MAG: hypothetical protein LUH15_13045 [Tannerellaceae bacterium]|nr:hypothetical protein [Tannerellaceae bacterium]